ncbi:hypothetical protein L1887_38518 [Cichorium endivia]|nr:hypothetical protein L1887_38518 [Cichorium endivia]
MVETDGSGRRVRTTTVSSRSITSEAPRLSSNHRSRSFSPAHELLFPVFTLPTHSTFFHDFNSSIPYACLLSLQNPFSRP